MWETRISFSSFMSALEGNKIDENIVILFVPQTEADFALSREMVQHVQEMDRILGDSVALITLSAPEKSYFTVRNFPWDLIDGRKRNNSFIRVAEARRTENAVNQGGLMEFERQLRDFFKIKTNQSCLYLMFKGFKAVESIPVSGMTIESLKTFLREIRARSNTYQSFPDDIKRIQAAHRVAINYLPLKNRAIEKKRQVEMALKKANDVGMISVEIDEIKRIADVRLSPRSSINALNDIQKSGRLQDVSLLQQIVKLIDNAAKAELERDLFLRNNFVIDLEKDAMQKRMQLRDLLASLAALAPTASSDIAAVASEERGPSLIIGGNLILLSEIAQLASDTLELLDILINGSGLG